MMNGRPAAPGVAIGTACVSLHDDDFGPPRKITEGEVDQEIQRFHEALRLAQSDIVTLRDSVEKGRKVRHEDLAIFDTQVAYLDDPVFRADVEKAIREQKINLEGAISTSIRNFARIFELVENNYIKERASDLRDVGLRVLRHVRGGPPTERSSAPHSQILITDELLLSDLAQLEIGGYSGVVAEGNAERSHPVIMARSLGIPIVTGLPGIVNEVNDGDEIILDGSAGSVYVNPDAEVKEEYQVMRDEFLAGLDAHPEIVGLASKTRDGTSLRLLANIAKLSDLEVASYYNLDGVGLFRTEFDYAVSPTPPTAEKLTEIYGSAAERLNGRPLNVRLLEVDTSRPFFDLNFPKELNPALGERSLRLLLHHPDVLRPQLRALVQVAEQGNVGVLVPFVASSEDLQAIRREIDRVASELGVGKPKLRLGIVIEIPGMIFQLQDVLPEVDFCVVGADNLTQYLMAADRNNSAISSYQDKATPGVVRALAHLTEILKTSGKEFYPYGDIVADAVFTPFLLGIGFHTLSMTPVAIPRVKKVLTRLDLKDCQTLAHQCLELTTREEIQGLLETSHERILQDSSKA